MPECTQGLLLSSCLAESLRFASTVLAFPDQSLEYTTQTLCNFLTSLLDEARGERVNLRRPVYHRQSGAWRFVKKAILRAHATLPGRKNSPSLKSRERIFPHAT